LISKKSNNFKKVVQRLEYIGIPELATKYAGLEKVLVEHKVAILRRT